MPILNWKNFERSIKNLGREQLISLIRELYGLNQINKEYLCLKQNIGYTSPAAKKLIDVCQQKIRKCFFNSNGPNLSHAKTLVTNFCKSTLHTDAKLHVMLHFCETGSEFDATYGADYEKLYTSIENMFGNFIKLIQTADLNTQKKYKPRILKFLTSTDHCGYGHRDILDDVMSRWKQQN